MSENRCVCCGNIIPDGSMVCYACETNSFAIQKKGSLIRISENDNFAVHYDKDRGMYRVSVFEDYHFKDEYWFDAYVPTAHWIDHGYEIECSACGFTCNDEYYLGEAVACPNCGFLMDSREDMTNIQR